MAPAGHPSPELLAAAGEMGAVYLQLGRLGYLPLNRWSVADRLPVSVRLLTALTHVHAADRHVALPRRLPAHRRPARYVASYGLVTASVRAEAAAAAQQTLAAERAVLGRLASRLAAPGIADRLHEASGRVMRAAGGSGTVRQDIEAANAELGPVDASWSASRMYEYRTALAAAARARVAEALHAEVAAATSERPALDPREMAGAGVRAEVSELLRILFAHPDGVALLAGYAGSPIAGAERAATAVADASQAALKFAAELEDDEDDVWRYGPLVLMGVRRLGLGDVAGFPEHMVDLGQVLGRSAVRAVIDDLGLVLFCVGLVFTGPVGAAVLASADLALTGAGAALTYLDEKQRQLAVDASAFRAEQDRIAQSGGYGETALAGATALVSAVGLLGAASKLLSAKPRTAGTAPSGLELETAPGSGTQAWDGDQLEGALEAGGDRASWSEAELETRSRRRTTSTRRGNPAETLTPQKMSANHRKTAKADTEALGAGAPRELTPEEIDGSRGTAHPLAGPPPADPLTFGEVPLSRLEQETVQAGREAHELPEYGLIPEEALTRGAPPLDLATLERTRQPGRHPGPVLTREAQGHLPDMAYREYRELLRKGTPSESLKEWARGQLTPGTPDPIIPTIPVDTASADHIVAVELIWQFPGFAELDLRAQLKVLNTPENIMAVSTTVNVRRGSAPYAAWPGIEGHPIPLDIRKQMIQREQDLTRLLQRRIESLLAEQRRVRGTGIRDLPGLPVVPPGLGPALAGGEPDTEPRR